MKHRIVFLFCVAFAMAATMSAQSKTITNSNLEAYKLQRVQAEREYRDNYARLGLSSPEELERRREQSRLETVELSAKLRAERLERGRMELQARSNLALANAYSLANQRMVESVSNDRGYFWSYGWSNGRRFRYRNHRQFGQYQQPGYFAGGQFWATGPRTAPRPLFVTPRR